MSRREFVTATSLTGAGVAALATGITLNQVVGRPQDPTGPGTIRQLGTLENVPVRSNEDVLVRMQRDLVKAMAKPVEERRWIMMIDTRKCVGCDACTVGCVSENKLPPGVVYRPVVKEETGEFPNLQLRFTPRPCMQCENPPCVPVCPVKATWKRPDGITTIDYDKCIGCRYCCRPHPLPWQGLPSHRLRSHAQPLPPRASAQRRRRTRIDTATPQILHRPPSQPPC